MGTSNSPVSHGYKLHGLQDETRRDAQKSFAWYPSSFLPNLHYLVLIPCVAPAFGDYSAPQNVTVEANPLMLSDSLITPWALTLSIFAEATVERLKMLIPVEALSMFAI